MGREAEGGSGCGTHVNPWLTHVNVWQKPLQYCKVISLQLIKINEKKKLNNTHNYLHLDHVVKKLQWNDLSVFNSKVKVTVLRNLRIQLF